jgi:site-specific DNA recombinase
MTDVLRLFLYARKSSKPDDRQALSIPRQLAELIEYAQRCGIIIVAKLIEKESAMKPGREVFNDLLRRIEAGEADGILAWHPDRLARNPSDGARIIQLLESRVIKTIKFPTFPFENTSHGRYSLGLAFVQSTYYSDNLSELTKGGFREKIRRKEYPGSAPIGYLNDARIKRIVIDKKRAPIVEDLFERYATGKETLDSMRDFLASRGVRTSKGKLICRWQVAHILKNPIYYGHFRWAGDVHEGSHKPIVTKDTFDRVQRIIEGRKKWSPRVSHRVTKPFVQLLRCATCGYGVTAEIQKGHTYYRCTRKSKAVRCSQPYLNEKLLDAQLCHLVQPFSFTDAEANEMLQLIATDVAQDRAQSASVLHAMEHELKDVQAKLERLKRMLLDGLIDHDDALIERKSLMSKKRTLEERIHALASKPNAWVEPFRNWVLEAQRVRSVADSAILPPKAALAKKIFGSNLVLDARKARGEAINPWSYLTQRELGDTLVDLYYRARTYFQRSAGATAHDEERLSPCPSGESNARSGEG